MPQLSLRQPRPQNKASFSTSSSSPSSSSVSSSSSSLQQQEKSSSPSSPPPQTKSPYLCIITPEDSCDNDIKLNKTLDSIHSAVATNMVDIVSVRIVAARKGREQQKQQQQQQNQDIVHHDNYDDDYDDEFVAAVRQRVVNLIHRLLLWTYKYEFHLVVSSDWIDIVQSPSLYFYPSYFDDNSDIDGNTNKPIADSSMNREQSHQQEEPLPLSAWSKIGIHFKERHRHLIPTFMRRYRQQQQQQQELQDWNTMMRREENERRTATTSTAWITNNHCLIGTSVHSIESAKDIFVECIKEGILLDYIFVGTCYRTPSHPEKDNAELLEGPKLPGQVKSTLLQQQIQSNNGNGITCSNHTNDGNGNDELLVKETDMMKVQVPNIYAIGGINISNCYEPVTRYGADGVATISAILFAQNPRNAVIQMKKNMINND